MATTNEFHIGLCLAGAISAGAYTAGVMDFLIEALDRWEVQKTTGGPQVPQHKINLSVIGGASAGGMTGMIMGMALQKKFDPIRRLESNESLMLRDRPENPFYHSWVDLLDGKDPVKYPEMLDYLLDPGDIKDGKVTSLLNSSFVEEVANRHIQTPTERICCRPYIHDKLRVFATMTNLIGLEQSLGFQGNEGAIALYHLQDHKDYGCFSFSKEASPGLEGWELMDFSDVSILERYKRVAMGTGAFPLGLAPVELSRRSELLINNPWLRHITQFGKKPVVDPDYITTVVDGGMLNNEPFEKVREALDQVIGKTDQENPQDYGKFRSTILMVDPFPSQSNALKPGTDLKGTLGSIVSTLLNQVRVKPEHLVASLASNMAGQYVISPIRYVFGRKGEEKVYGDKAIACGSLDGFGGFLSKKFRIHDYFLGRANCEKFLMDHFTVPIEDRNPIFEEGYRHLDHEHRQKFMSKTDKKPGMQIIPIFKSEEPSTFLPQWPKIDLGKVFRYREKIYGRVEKILLNSFELNKLDYALLWAGGKIFLNRKITDAVMDATERSLREHSLVQGS